MKSLINWFKSKFNNQPKKKVVNRVQIALAQELGRLAFDFGACNKPENDKSFRLFILSHGLDFKQSDQPVVNLMNAWLDGWHEAHAKLYCWD